MTDQKLLELAAKAVGLSFASQNATSHGVYCNNATWWNPLTDDGDALRLAVNLGINVRTPSRWYEGNDAHLICLATWHDKEGEEKWESVNFKLSEGGDPTQPPVAPL